MLQTVSLSKEETLFQKQIRHLQEENKRCELACEEHEKNIKIQTAKCASVEKEVKDSTEYLEFELAIKDKRLAEVRKMLELQKATLKHEQEEMNLKINKDLTQLQDQLDELTSHLPKLETKHVEIKEKLLQEIQSRKDQLVLDQKTYDATVKELTEQQLDQVLVERVYREREEAVEKAIKDEFLDLVTNQRVQHKTCQQNLAFLIDNTPKVREQRDTVEIQKEEDDKVTLDMEQDCGISIDNIVLKKEDQKKREMRKRLETQVKDLSFSVEDQERDMTKTKKYLRRAFGSNLASVNKTHQVQNMEIGHLKLFIDKEISRNTELKMGKKEAEIIFKNIIKEPKMDPQKLRRLHAILESFAPLK